MPRSLSPWIPQRRRARAGTRRLQVDPERTVVTVIVRRAGPLAKLGHDHVITSADEAGSVWLGEHTGGLVVSTDPARRTLRRGHASGTRRLRVLSSLHQCRMTPGRARVATCCAPRCSTGNIFLPSRCDPRRASGVWPQPIVRVAVTLKGVEREQEIAVAVERDGNGVIARGELRLNQTDFGMRPFSVAGGAISRSRTRSRSVLKSRPRRPARSVRLGLPEQQQQRSLPAPRASPHPLPPVRAASAWRSDSPGRAGFRSGPASWRRGEDQHWCRQIDRGRVPTLRSRLAATTFGNGCRTGSKATNPTRSQNALGSEVGRRDGELLEVSRVVECTGASSGCENVRASSSRNGWPEGSRKIPWCSAEIVETRVFDGHAEGGERIETSAQRRRDPGRQRALEFQSMQTEAEATVRHHGIEMRQRFAARRLHETERLVERERLRDVGRREADFEKTSERHEWPNGVRRQRCAPRASARSRCAARTASSRRPAPSSGQPPTCWNTTSSMASATCAGLEFRHGT